MHNDSVEISEINDTPHQWAYSFMPSKLDNDEGIYLVGYCKGCRNTFTCLVKKSWVIGQVVMTYTEIPKIGCVVV